MAMLFFVQVREDNVWMQSTGVINAKEMDLLFKVIIIMVIMMGLLYWQQCNGDNDYIDNIDNDI